MFKIKKMKLFQLNKQVEAKSSKSHISNESENLKKKVSNRATTERYLKTGSFIAGRDLLPRDCLKTGKSKMRTPGIYDNSQLC